MLTDQTGRKPFHCPIVRCNLHLNESHLPPLNLSPLLTRLPWDKRRGGVSSPPRLSSWRQTLQNLHNKVCKFCSLAECPSISQATETNVPPDCGRTASTALLPGGQNNIFPITHWGILEINAKACNFSKHLYPCFISVKLLITAEAGPKPEKVFHL